MCHYFVKVLILKFDSDFISNTLEAQPECDCKVPVSSKQERLDISARYSGIRLERVGQLTKTQRKNCR
jgi:primosomal replication protein N